MKESVPPPPQARAGVTERQGDITAALSPSGAAAVETSLFSWIGGPRRWGFQDFGGLLCHPEEPLAVTSGGLHTFGGAAAAAELQFSKGPGLRRKNGTVCAGGCV